MLLDQIILKKDPISTTQMKDLEYLVKARLVEFSHMDQAIVAPTPENALE